MRRAVSAQLRAATDFVCQQTVDRARWSPSANLDESPSIEDILRLEVGWVGGNEVFGWPDVKGFEDKPLSELVGGGAVSSGEFLAHARAVFLSGIGNPQLRGAEYLEGDQAWRFEYRVPGPRTGYRLATPGGAAEVPYSGSFWVDADSLRLRRLTVVAEEIPVAVGIEQIQTTVDYQQATLRDGEAVLPVRAEVKTRFRDGTRLQNRSEFQSCRAFGATSSLSFGVEAANDAPAAPISIGGTIRPGELLVVDLQESIEWGRTRVGDAVEGLLRKPLRRAGSGKVAKGAPVRLRVRRFQRRTEPEPFFVVGLSVERVGTASVTVAALEDIASPGAEILISKPAMAGAGEFRATHRETRIETGTDPGLPGVGSFYVFGDKLRLKRLRTSWRTRADGGPIQGDR